MKQIFIYLLGFMTLVCGSAYAEGFTVTSKDISGQLSHNQVLSGFGCSGKNLSPELSWENAPKGTKSFAITMYDKDAPTGSGFWHWVIFNIPGNVKMVEQDAGNLTRGIAPEGSIQSVTDFGKPGFGGACPPAGSGPHSYEFTVYALGVDKIDLGSDAPAALVGFFLKGNTLAKASLVGYYTR